VEQLDYNLLVRWFVGLNMDDAIWDGTVFTINRRSLRTEYSACSRSARNNFSGAIDGRPVFAFSLRNVAAVLLRPHRS
jgi:hypothetical protein